MVFGFVLLNYDCLNMLHMSSFTLNSLKDGVTGSGGVSHKMIGL